MIRGSRWVWLAVAAVWFAAFAYSVLTARVLFGDGASFLLKLLISPHNFLDYDTQRTYASLITQAPVLFGQRLELRFGTVSGDAALYASDVSGYAALYALGVFGIPALLMTLALFLARKQRLLFMAIGLAIVVYGFGVNFINSEANLFFGLVWLAVTILALNGTVPILRGLILPLIAIVLLRTYEGMLLVGPVLAFWSISAARKSSNHIEQIGFVIAAVLFVMGSVIALGGFLSPHLAYNASGFLANAFTYLKNPQFFLLLSGLAATLANFMPRRRWLLFSAAISALLGLGFVIMIVHLDGFYSYDVYYNNRSFLVLFLPVFVGSLLATYLLKPAWLLPGTEDSRYLIILIPFIFAVVGDGIGTYRWNTYTKLFCQVLDVDMSPQQRIDMLKNSGSRTAWRWTHPTMSVLLRDLGSKAMVVNEAGASNWQPFEPEYAPVINYRGLCQSPLLGSSRLDSFDLPLSFTNGTYPSYVASITGLSHREGWATWSDGNLVEIRFTRLLPNSFDLTLRIGSAFGASKRLPVKVRAGSRELQFIADHEPTEVVLQFRDVVDATTLTFYILKPESPLELATGKDPRKLGIAFQMLTVRPR